MNLSRSSQCRTTVVPGDTDTTTLTPIGDCLCTSVEIMEPERECRLKDTLCSDTTTHLLVSLVPCGIGLGISGCKTTARKGTGSSDRFCRQIFVPGNGQNLSNVHIFVHKHFEKTVI